MKPFVIILIIIAIALVCILVFLFKVFLPIYRGLYTVRMSDPSGFTEYFLETHPDVKYEFFSCPSPGGADIRGLCFIPEGIPEGLIVFTHGYNRSIENYLGEARCFMKAGFRVLFFDGTGVGISGGDSFIGMPQHVLDMEAVLEYIEKDEYLSSLPLLLFGHSWGGYAADSVGCIRNHHPVAIISVSAFNDVIETIRPFAITRYGKMTGIIMAMFRVFLFKDFGKAALYTSVKGLSQAVCPVFVCQSRDDRLIDFERNFGRLEKAYGDRPDFTFQAFDGRDHDVLTPPENDRRQMAILKELKKKNITVCRETFEKDPLVRELWELQGQTDEELIGRFVRFYEDSLGLSK